MTAHNTGMYDTVFFPLFFNRYWLHHPITEGVPVSRVYVNMLTPKTVWAMVCIAITEDFVPTLLAHKIFFCFGKSFSASHED